MYLSTFTLYFGIVVYFLNPSIHYQLNSSKIDWLLWFA